MSRKSNLKKFQSITSGNMALTSITSAITNVEFLDNIGVQLQWSGSPVGNFEIQVSLNYDQDINGNVINAGTWVPLTFPTYNNDIPTSAGSPLYIDLNQLSAPWVRVVYTKTSGTGTLNTYICGKMV